MDRSDEANCFWIILAQIGISADSRLIAFFFRFEFNIPH